MLPSNQKGWSNPEYWIIIISSPQRESILSVFSLHVEHPFWGMWLWNSGDNYLVLLLCWFSEENVGRVGLWNPAFWCELGNFILRELFELGMLQLNARKWMKRLTGNQMLVLHTSWDIKNKQHNKRHLGLEEFTHRWVWRHFAYWERGRIVEYW